MTEIEDLLYTLTDSVNLAIYDVDSGFKWVFYIGDKSHVELENIKNDLISVTFITDYKAVNDMAGYSGKKSLVVPIADLYSFIKGKAKQQTDKSNIGFRKEVKNSEYYDDIIEKILKKEEIQTGTIEIEEEDQNVMSYSKVIIYNDGTVSHMVTCKPYKTSSLLEMIEVSANFLIESKDKSGYTISRYKKYYPVSLLNEYPLFNDLMPPISFRPNRKETFDSILNDMREGSDDESLLKLIQYRDLSKNLKETKPKNKVKKI